MSTATEIAAKIANASPAIAEVMRVMDAINERWVDRLYVAALDSEQDYHRWRESALMLMRM